LTMGSGIVLWSCWWNVRNYCVNVRHTEVKIH
jgi:hypothetical protein